MQRFVLWDLDNTLVDRRGTLTDWVGVFVARHRLGDEARQELLALLGERAYPSSFEEIRTRYRLTSTTDDLWRSYCADIAAMVSCPADVLTGLDELRRHGWRIGIATNGATDIQTAKLRATGIHSRVEGICISEEVAARKPEREHFTRAAARCGTTLSAGGWMVGDNPVNDVGGGRAAGLGTIWIANGSRWPADLPEPDHRVQHTRAAIELLLSDSATRSTT
ncbi:HAD family hydrolase [Streptomyces sp. NPDC057474]|uniref:HAD family hydrolase n=1 Tax=Streptomyces sp. NPDC057474 TaxID=3346144 RepID=UPI0036A4F1E0